MTTYTATYSPEDNKLRLYASSRLDADLYKEARECGFIWAPKQELFVAPKWTPGRADFLLSLCDEIEDEDKSLVDRAEERADRFSDYQDSRTKDAISARNAVSSIADNIPFGQPILVGHHSERRARKDAERITNGMKRAVQMWDTAEYWQRRAAGAVRNAKYKEQPAVRARRIKGIEADKRKDEKTKTQAVKFLVFWKLTGLTYDQAIHASNYDHISRCFTLAEFPREAPKSQYEGQMSLYSALTAGVITAEQAAAIAIPSNEYLIASCDRWIAHYDNRLSYERAMLEEQGGTAATQFNIEVGGKVKIGREWSIVTRLNMRDGVLLSVTTSARYCSVRGVEDISDYLAPTAAEVATVQAATKLAPLCNFPGEGFIHMTKAEWDKAPTDYKGTEKFAETETTGRYRTRKMLAVFAGLKSNDANISHSWPNIFITDAKRVDPPKKAPDTTTAPAEKIEVPLPDPRPSYQAKEPTQQQAEFDLMRASVKEGVKIVSAPQLFPTPPTLAARMVEMADLQDGHKLLEPSAGTGNILKAIREASGAILTKTAVEINHSLCEQLRIREIETTVVHRDFLECCGVFGKFDRIIMNPPFSDGQDIKHIQHAISLLSPAGRLVAICANGPRQNNILRPLIERSGGTWQELPADTFNQKDSGTAVRTVLLSLVV